MWNMAELIEEMPSVGAFPIDASNFLDMEDINAPGNAIIPKKTGNPKMDFALYKISKYAQSEDPEERKLFAKNICETTKELEAQAPDFIFPLVASLIEDVDEVKFELMQQMPELLRLIIAVNENCYRKVVEEVIPPIRNMIFDENFRSITCDVFAKITSIFTMDDRGAHILTFILTLAHDDENEDLKVQAVELLNRLAGDFGIDLCEQFLTMEILALADDPKFKVRSAVALNISKISSTVSQPCFMNKLAPAFLRLCQDNIWRVRKSCVESISGILEAAQDEDLVAQLTNIIMSFTQDNSRWVKEAACKEIGPFVIALNGREISQDLVACYIAMADSTKAQNPQENESMFFCAYNFPAIIWALSAEAWTFMAGLHKKMSRDIQNRVRKSLANSIAEVATIVGQENTERDLVPVYEAFLRDESEVQQGAIVNLAKFISILSMNERERFIPVIQMLQARKDNWRTRSILAGQLEQIVHLYTVEVTHKMILPIVIALWNDDVAVVRNKAACGLGAVFNRLVEQGDEYKRDMVNILKAFKEYQSFVKRKQFALICSTVAEDPMIFDTYCREDFISVCHDPIPIVRISFAQVSAEMWKKKSSIITFKRMLSYFRRDTDPDVKRAAEQFDTPFKKNVNLTPPCKQTDNFDENFDDVITFTGAEGDMKALDEFLEIDEEGLPLDVQSEIDVNLGKIDWQTEVRQNFVADMVKKIIELAVTFT